MHASICGKAAACWMRDLVTQVRQGLGWQPLQAEPSMHAASGRQQTPAEGKTASSPPTSLPNTNPAFSTPVVFGATGKDWRSPREGLAAVFPHISAASASSIADFTRIFSTTTSLML